MTHLDISTSAMNSLNIQMDELRPGILAAVSGGSDSMALAMLLRNWCGEHGIPFSAAICDHGLRRESAEEAEIVSERLTDMGVDNRVLKLRIPTDGGGGIQERARHARHAALQNYARRQGYAGVAFGHHLMDHVETVAQRMEAGTDTVRGRAGILPVRVMGDLLYIRPLLNFGKGELRDLLREEGVRWVEDPSNQNEAYTRVRIRNELKENPQRVEDIIAIAAEARQALFEAQLRGEEMLRESTRHLWQGGAMWLNPAGLDDSMAAEEVAMSVIQRVTGSTYPNHPRKILEILRSGNGTIGGMRMTPHREGGVIAFREFSKMQPNAVPARHFATWDNRIRLGQDVPDATISAVGEEGATALRKRGWLKEFPHAVLATLPCLRDSRTGQGISIPQAGWGLPIDLLPTLRANPAPVIREQRSLTFGM